MNRPTLEPDVVNQEARDSAAICLRKAGVRLPTFADLADPSLIDRAVVTALAGIDPDAAHPLNLFRVHWFNGADRRSFVPLPEHIVLTEKLTGVKAPIVVLLGDRFPLIGAHKVLAAYGCLAPRVVTGQFDPSRHRAIWPSTGNYCRGGVAISRIMSCRGVAVLPEGMSRERFDWLERWVASPGDIVRTPGSESNVRELYDKCEELEQDPANIVFNQFSDFGNYLVHRVCTGRAVERLFCALADSMPGRRLHSFVSASGSSGVLGAGDYLKEKLGSKIVVIEPLECPTLLYSGFGEHNIQGIGNRHVPLIHNVMNTDLVVAVSDDATDSLNLLFNTPVGRSYLLGRRKVEPGVVKGISSLGLSSICNVLGAIKTAKYYGLGPDDVVVTVATDGADMYVSQQEIAVRKRFPEGFDEIAAAETCGRYLLGASTDHVLEPTAVDRARIFNLGYYTWVEQRGVPEEEFVIRREQSFWTGLGRLLPEWDRLIAEFNTIRP